MRRALLSVLAAAVLLGFGGLVRSADEDSKALIAKAVKAHGGQDILDKYKGMRAKTKGKMTLPGVGEVEFTQEIASMQPDKFRETVNLEVMGKKFTAVTASNGDRVSIEANGKAIPITDDIKKTLEDARHVMRTARLTSLLKDPSYEFSPLGEVKVEGKPAIGLRISSRGKKDVNLYFSKETGLLSKMEHRSFDPMSKKEFTEERIILEYQKGKEGIPQPRKVLVNRDGEKFIEAEVIEASFHEKLDDSDFEVAK